MKQKIIEPIKIIEPSHAKRVLNPFMHSRLFYFKVLDTAISIKKGCLINFIVMIFRKIPKLYENNIDPDRLPLSVVSDLDLQCFPTSLLWDARLKFGICCY